ncbi:MAG TPA: hydroxyacid dehydrogenase [Kiritimatiellae bacterium]|nr:hydroxyacid dehydrogenase [Kiritimatiellia bacterium]
MTDIFLYEVFEEEEHLLRQLCPPGLDFASTPATIQESGHELPPAPVISIRTQSVIPPHWIDRVQAVLSRSAGYDHLLPVHSASGGKIRCGYLPRYCVRAVAEQAALLWMSLLRKLPLQTVAFSTFHRNGLTGLECAAKTLLVVGVGNIGSEIVRLGRALGMKVLGVDIVRRFRRVRYVEFARGLPRAHVVVAAMNLTVENRGFFSYARMKHARPGTVFVNVARGELSPTADLLRLLEEGILGGVALDVYENEPSIARVLRKSGDLNDPRLPPALRRLAQQHPNVLLTPHNAFNTVEAVTNKARHTIAQILHYRRHHRFKWEIPRSLLSKNI